MVSMYLLESFVSDFAPDDVIICNSGKGLLLAQVCIADYDLFKVTHCPKASSMSPRLRSCPLTLPLHVNGISSSAGYAWSWDRVSNGRASLFYSAIMYHLNNNHHPNSTINVLVTFYQWTRCAPGDTYHVSIVGMVEHVKNLFPMQIKNR